MPAVSASAEFVKAGVTLMPTAPTQRLVVRGFNRYIRNPMYFGRLLALTGQALLLGSFRLLIYSVLVGPVPAVFVRWYEVPTFPGQFGAEHQAYRQAVPPGGLGCAHGRPAHTTSR